MLTLLAQLTSNLVVTSGGRLKLEKAGPPTQCTGAMPTLDTRGSRELPHIVVAGLVAIETGFDAIAFPFDLWKCKIDFRGNTCDIKASYIYTTGQ
jgi:hypothetical protein